MTPPGIWPCRTRALRHGALVLLLGVLLLMIPAAHSDSQDEDLTFEDEGLVRLRRDLGDASPMPSPTLHEDEEEADPGILTRVRRQFDGFLWGRTDPPPAPDDEDMGSGVIEGSAYHQRTFRTKIHLLRQWQPAYSNKGGPEYTRTARSIQQAMVALLYPIPGEKIIQVSDMKQATGTGNILVTVDIMHADDTDQKNRIRQKVREQLERGDLGGSPVNTRFFSFDEPRDTATTAVTPEGCRGDAHFTCVGGVTICEVQQCDGNEDCPLGDDEIGCGCTEGSFGCDGLRCLDNDRKCDGVQDCADNTDEENCDAPPSCSDDEAGPHLCDDRVTLACFCDGNVECPGGEDEAESRCFEECTPGTIPCDFGTQCIPESQICNGIRNCQDGTDEQNCPPPPCLSNQFRCQSGKCIEDFRRCDYIEDCPDGDDEESCPCEPPNFQCISGMCISQSKRCDQNVDCDDGSDEDGCPCSDGYFTCRDGQCVEESIRCDGEPDCIDGSDELTCTECIGATYLCGDGKCILEESVCDGYNDCDTDELDCCEGSGFFQCDNGITCLDIAKQCDGVADCIDRLDEQDCLTPQPGCTESEFTCGDGMCIDYTQRCNGLTECRDGSDERGCPCRDDQWRCGDGTCLPGSSRCDGTPECADVSDEDGCPPQVCQAGEWTCRDGSCIPGNKRCDQVYDCLDRSDEENCPPPVCGPGEWTCVDESCIPLEGLCDGVPQCSDGTDETNCVTACGAGEWMCGDGSCIPEDRRCDRQYDCSDYTDEENCPSLPGCGPGEFTCEDGSCIPEEQRCDRQYDCGDYSDEADCPPGACGVGEWTCRDGSCIPYEYRCDGQYDCPEYTDEENCPSPECGFGEWRCRDGLCIPQDRVCDGQYDCPDYSDEDFCHVIGCRPGEWTCGDGSCIPEDRRCDGRPDCSDRSDELGCDPRPCDGSQWTCSDGTCIPLSRHCDGRYDCPDYSDEYTCTLGCNPGEWQCRNQECVPASARCDGVPQCVDRSDEENCTPQPPPRCLEGEITCGDGSCVPGSARCNNIYECPDGTDEAGCTVCMWWEWQCWNGQCIPSHQRCDGTTHCQDYSDECRCPACDRDQFRCADGLCIPAYLVCDGRPYCRDGSDEAGCPSPCSDDEFRCGDGQCIPQYLVCDRQPHCRDGSDERDCGKCDPVTEWQCDSGHCIDFRLRCNGRIECIYDDSDERLCPPPACRPDQFRCEDGACLDIRNRCNGYPDCRGGEDERGCPPVCGSDQFRCDRDGYCISNQQVCDGRQDCSDGTDEANCRCSLDEWQCRDGQCIPIRFRCDGRQDCRDGSDETVNCPQCGANEFTCQSGECIPASEVCDGYPRCQDGSDERNCHVFRCNDGRTIDASLRCNGRFDCSDGSDEADCEGLNLKLYPEQQTIQQTREVVFQCRDEGPLRVPVRWARDNNRPLPLDSTDVRGRLTMPDIQLEHSGTYFCEAQGVPSNMAGRRKAAYLQVNPYVVPTIPSVTVCTINEATCMDGQCIPKDKVCDGVYDCRDTSDEMRCNPLGCEPNEFQCDNKKCVLKTWLCDSDNDCGDGSDEAACPEKSPDSSCSSYEFSCHAGNQCIPKSFHCDNERDCQDGTDEQGCSSPIVIEPPPRNVVVQILDDFTLTCTVIGVPTPLVIWRLNWGHVPSKCRMTSEDGRGTLFCPSAQPTDQGAYSCEALNTHGTVFAQPDAIVQVRGSGPAVCVPPQFNAAAYSAQDCLTCFCFGATDQCYSSDRFVTQLPPPRNDAFTLVGVNQNQIQGNFVIRDREYPLSRSNIISNNYGVQLSVDRTKLGGPSDLIIYFSLPETHTGEQLTAYGGFLRYKIRYQTIGAGQALNGPDVIMKGNGLTLMYVNSGVFRPDTVNQVDAEFTTGQWFKRVTQRGRSIQAHEPASREEIMMVLADMEFLLIRALYNDGLYLNTTLYDVQLDTAVISDSTQSRAVYVEVCRCPEGYTGMSCQDCAPNYRRVSDGPWLGRCVPQQECGPNEYGDPARNIQCLPCPCPLSTPNNQFSSSCYLANDGQVTCNCQQGYQGRRCESCAVGYTGNPQVPGDSCQPDRVPCMTTFTCLDGSVHPWSRRCDGIKDCNNYEDEKECDVCFNSGHRCSDGTCVHFERICDDHMDCSDQSDENPNNCLEKLPCNHIHQWTCADRTCISRKQHCDGTIDCPDRSDERYCNCTCDDRFHFRCSDGICLNSQLRCNGRVDCPDGSDELGCSCDLQTEHECGDGSCIDRQRVCDQRVDCSDRSDEPPGCNCDPRTTHRCGDGTCIDLRQVCDGRFDCQDYSDEPSGCSCDLTFNHLCGDGTCIDRQLLCNGRFDCSDGSDESSNCNCDPFIMHQCGDGTCIDRRRVCDGRLDCRDRSDEPSDCPSICNPLYEFTCNSGSCIDNRLVCNGYGDCRDGSDEAFCPVCTATQFQCGDMSCIDRWRLCDGFSDCRDGSDEREQAGCCVGPDFFHCNDGNCISALKVCDGYPDCSDQSDESNCYGGCSREGSQQLEPLPSGYCQCKALTTGPKCDQCKTNSFYLHENNRDGCISCFCMGITVNCSSSNWYRQQESVSFTNSRQGFELVDKDQKKAINSGLYVDSGSRELIFREFSLVGQEVLYWSLPARFRGNKVTSYGGYLTYSLRYVPSRGEQISTNNAYAVEIYGNDITLRHYISRDVTVSPSRLNTFRVPMYEQFWEKQNGQTSNREHFLMALADLKYILIKATYATNTDEVALKEVTLDYAEPRNTGLARAYAVEMCGCPEGYNGLSCEDCAIGYTRSLSGVFLGTCVPCNCNGHSRECDPETGECSNCQDNTAGPYCEQCAPGYENRDGSCVRRNSQNCNCDPRGQQGPCTADGQCQCKANVFGDSCDTCRPGFFRLTSANPDGCLECWCSGVTSECFSSNYYRIELPMQLFAEHGFSFSDRPQINVIRDNLYVDQEQNQISFTNFNDLPDSQTYYWSLPQMFTGNRLASYGGNLSVTQWYETESGGDMFSDSDIIIRSSGGREFIWMKPTPLRPNEKQPYSVLLTESSFTVNQQLATREEFLEALSSVEAILIRATLSNRMRATHLQNVIMDTAVPSTTGQPRALDVEQCKCPREYTGLSCEQCRPGHFRDRATNRCVQCPCNGREESCTQLPSGAVECNCLPGYYGTYCTRSGLMLELKPIKVMFNRHVREVYENFTCSYHSYEPLRITITREPTWVDKDSHAAALFSAEAPHRTDEYTNGARHYFLLRLSHGHRRVTCRVYDSSNKEVAQMVSQILYTNNNWRQQKPTTDNRPRIRVTVSEPFIRVDSLGSTVELRCSATSMTGPQTRLSVTWSKADGQLPYGRSVDNRQGTLTISNVRTSDGGVYICAAVDGLGRTETANITLEVPGVENPRVVLSEDREVLEMQLGGTLEVRCSGEGSPPPVVAWSFGAAEDLPPNSSQQNGVLIIRNAQSVNSGEYYCTATNNVGRSYARIVINVIDRPSFPGGEVQISQPVVQTQPGDTVRVTCSAALTGRFNIEWSRQTNTLPAQAIVTSGELTIPNAQPVDSGIYVCRITDLRTSIFRESSTRILIIAIPVSRDSVPTVRMEPERLTISQGNSMELRCVTTGDPRPTITWTKAREVLGPNVIQDGPVLRISNAMVSDRGMYICTAQNDAGSAQAAAIVEVERREPPVIQIYPKVEQTIVVGASALFQCHLTSGIPTPTVRWSRADGRPMTSNTETLNGGVLRFNQVQGDEEGSYICTAENDAGSVTAIAMLEVQSMPSITIRPGPSPYMVREGERLQLECSADGDPAPAVSWQRLQVNFPSNIPSRSTSPTIAVYEIGSVSKSDEGTYQCSARNDAGVSEERIQVVVTQDSLPGRPTRPEIRPPRPPFRPNRPSDNIQRVVVPYGGSSEFTCSSRDPNAENIEYNFRRTDGEPFSQGVVVRRDGVMELSNVDETASGEYACVGTDRVTGSVLFTIYYFIEVLAPPRISLDPARQIVRPNDRVQIRCTATGAQPITITWSKQVGFMPPSVVINGGELTFRGIKTTDAGRYECTAVNSAGTTRAVAEVIVNASDKGYNQLWTSGDSKIPLIPGVSFTEDLFFDTELDDDTKEYEDSSSTPGEGYFLTLGKELKCSFVCHNPTICLTDDRICDGMLDCPDGADEEACDTVGVLSNDIVEIHECSDLFKCGNGLCYLPYLNCDGVCDCNDCKDEKICVYRHGGKFSEEPLLTAIQPEVTLYVGQSAELRCEMSGIDPNDVTWTRIGGRLPLTARPSANILRIPRVQPEDSGNYQCDALTPTGTRTSDVITLTVQRQRMLNIVVRSIPPRVQRGQGVNLVCDVDGDRTAAAISWRRLDGRLPRGHRSEGNVLRIPRVEDSGTYKCIVTTPQGVFEKTYALVIRDIENLDFGTGDQRLRSVKTRSAALGEGVTMDCLISLPGPVSYTWSKQGGSLPFKSVSQDTMLNIPDLGVEDAGLYVCTGRNNERSVDLLTLLLVGDVIPRFEESSYISLATIPRAYLNFDIEISFRPDSSNGLLLYNSQYSAPESGDYVALGLKDGYAEFRFNVGSGPAVLRSREPLALGEWHTIKISRNRKDGTMVVNGGEAVVGSSPGKLMGLDLVAALYLGGVPDYAKLPVEAGYTSGLRGCISRLIIGNNRNYDFIREAREKVGVRGCDTCGTNPCQNNGVCQEAFTPVGHKCFCPAGFSGPLCEDSGESCYPGVCGTGRCVNRPGGFECYCPFGKLGERCERDITIYEPAFGGESYIAYPTPRARLWFSVNLNFMPETLDDGVLMYSAQKERDPGDFVSLAIRNKRLEFRFNTGSGTAKIESEPIRDGQWIEVHANRSDRFGSMRVNDGPMVNGESPGSTRGLNLLTPLFIGGVDNSRIQISPDVEVSQGFRGCVSQIKLMGHEVALSEALVDSANVDQCGGSPCGRSPCQNQGQCSDDSSTPAGYTCTCPDGYSGHDCENAPGVCTIVQPCKNGGACVGSGEQYFCRCPLGFAGQHCETRVVMREMAQFSGDGWVDFNQTLLHQDSDSSHAATFEFTTRQPEGLLLWLGQEATESGRGQDYTSVAVRGGYVEFSYELGGGSVSIRSTKRVDNGRRHRLTVVRNGQEGSLTLDDDLPERDASPGQLHMLNSRGNVYIGGVPDYEVMTGGSHTQGFFGCLHRLTLGSRDIDSYMNQAVAGVNVTPCQRFRGRKRGPQRG